MNDNLHQYRTTGPPSLKQVLHQMNEAGSFELSVLTSAEGLPLATAPAHYDGARTAATAALLQRASNDTQSQLTTADVDEVTICDRDHTRLVCRYIPVREKGLILVVKVPPGRCYRRVTNQAIRRIKRLVS